MADLYNEVVNMEKHICDIYGEKNGDTYQK